LFPPNPIVPSVQARAYAPFKMLRGDGGSNVPVFQSFQAHIRSCSRVNVQYLTAVQGSMLNVQGKINNA
jgi:hypothetical protein